uniref:Nucleotide-diphospho-sugar transferase domain-containing protein n=1 Tax=viral metagenome TaxID=1070528 RepID=A0A6C0I884_9ZZZZ
MKVLITVLVILCFYILYHKEDLYILVYLTLCKHVKSNESLSTDRKYKIAILTIEDREEDYVKYHDKSVTDYCNRYSYDYIRLSTYKNVNVYWSKIFLVRDTLLKKNEYDYVMWLDSDTIICDNNISLNKIINNYGVKDIFIHYENYGFIINNLYNNLNSGIFIIKNSTIGIQFINELIDIYHKQVDIDHNNKIASGLWTGNNYEQGVMNLLIKTNKIYRDNTSIIPEYIFNTSFNASLKTNFIDDNLLDDVNSNCFIWHLPGRSPGLRSSKFKSVIERLR